MERHGVGVVDIGDGQAIVLAMGTGAGSPASVVGEVVREVLATGARPIALLDALRSGPLTDERDRSLFADVVERLSGYGNGIGVPSVGGEIRFATPQTANPIADVMCVGLVSVERPLSAGRRIEEGPLTVRVGAATGRGAGPFTGKLLIEACLELVERDLLEGLEALVGGPQEGMLAIVAPERLDAAVEVCGRWGLEAQVVPARAVVNEAPEHPRPLPRPASEEHVEDPTFTDVAISPADALLSLLASPNIASKRWVWEQFDSIVQGDTVRGPGGDAPVVRIEGGLKAIALATGGNGRYGSLDPYLGAVHAVAGAARDVAVGGARPIAMTDRIDLGDRARSEVMWQHSEALRGITDACAALDIPVTGGGVSFHGDSGGAAIWPTTTVGMLGLTEDHRLLVDAAFPGPGRAIYLLGETFPELGGSEFADSILGVVAGRPPGLDLEREVALQRFLIEAIGAELVASANDCSDGGLGVALARCALAGDCGFAVAIPGDLPPHVALFSESASRAVVTVERDSAESFESAAASAGVPCARLGETGGPRLVIDRILDLPLAEARATYEGALPHLMEVQGNG